MPSITPLSGSDGIDEVWGDYSGGEIVIAISRTGYVSQHVIRVGPFDSSGAYTSPPSGTVAGLQDEADNIVTLIRACYPASVSVAAVSANQTLSDHSGVAPFPFAFASTHFGAGTAGGAEVPTAQCVLLSSRGVDGSRWRLQLEGYSDALGAEAGAKIGYAAGTGAFKTLATYLTRGANGPVAAQHSNAVTHNGQPILSPPLNFLYEVNKRLRRHFKVV